MTLPSSESLVSPQAALLNQVAVLMRLAQVHDATNPILQPPLTALARSIRELEADGEIRVDLVADSFFVNKSLVKIPAGLAEAADGLRKTFARLAIQRLALSPAANEADLRGFLEVFQKHWRTPTPHTLKAEAFGAVRVAALGSASDEMGLTSATIDARQHLLKSYARLVILAKEAVSRVQSGAGPFLPQARRVVQALIDASKDHESLLLGLTRFPGFRGDLASLHAAVAAHCLAMGRRLGLSKVALVDVVLAALVHELGFVHPKAKPTDDPESQRPALLSMAAALADGVRPETAWHGAAAFETSLPAWHRDLLRPGALGRLIAVPSAFEHLTSPQPPHQPATPDQALRMLMDQAGVRFDPHVVTLFVSVVGIHPIGSMVKLSDGSIAVVIDVPADPARAARPIVRVVSGTSGAGSYVLDLANDSERSIVGPADPKEMQVNPTFFLLA
jgi:hypothetical protein